MALQHSAGLTRPPQDPHSAIERLGEHYLMRTACAVATTEPGKHRYTGIDEANLQRFTDEHTALAWFHAQLPLVMAIYEACARWGLDALTVRFADALWPMLRQIGQYNLQAKAQQTAAAAAERIDHPYWSVVLSRVGWALTHLDQAEQAIEWCARGLALAELCPAKHFAAGTALSTRSRAYAGPSRDELVSDGVSTSRGAGKA